MFENLVASRLSAFLSAYVEGFDPSQIITSVGVWNGRLDLHNLSIRPDALISADLPVKIISGRIAHLQVVVPWVNLTQAAATFTLDGVDIVLGTDFSSHSDAVIANRHKRSLLDEHELMARRRRPGLDPGFVQKFLYSFFYNFHLEIRNVRIRFEHQSLSDMKPFALEFVLDSVIIQSTNANNEPALTAAGDAFAYKVVNVEGFRLSWAALNSNIIADPDTDNIIPSLSLMAMLRLAKPSNSSSDSSPSPPIPRLHIQLIVDSISVHLLESVSRQLSLLIASFIAHLQSPRPEGRYDGRLARPNRPLIPVKGNARLWWQFMTRSWCDQQYATSWIRIRAFRQLFREYIALFKDDLAQGPGNSERSARLQTLEAQLSLDQILLMRDIAEQQLLKQETEQAQVVRKRLSRSNWRSFISGFLFSSSDDLNQVQAAAALIEGAPEEFAADEPSSSARVTHCLFRFQIRSLRLFVVNDERIRAFEALFFGLAGDFKLLNAESYLNVTLLQCEARDASRGASSPLAKIVDAGPIDVDVDLDGDNDALIELRLQRGSAKTDLMLAMRPVSVVLSRDCLSLIDMFQPRFAASSSSSSSNWWKMIPEVAIDIYMSSLVVVLPDSNGTAGIRVSIGQASLANSLILDEDGPSDTQIEFDCHVLDIALSSFVVSEADLVLLPLLDTVSQLSISIDTNAPDGAVRHVAIKSSLPNIRFQCSDEQRRLLYELISSSNWSAQSDNTINDPVTEPIVAVIDDVRPAIDIDIECFSCVGRFWSSLDSCDDGLLSISLIQLRLLSPHVNVIEYQLECADAVLENCRIPAVASEFSHWISIRHSFVSAHACHKDADTHSSVFSFKWRRDSSGADLIETFQIRSCSVHTACDRDAMTSLLSLLDSATQSLTSPDTAARKTIRYVQIDVPILAFSFLIDKSSHCLLKAELFDLSLSSNDDCHQLSIDNLAVTDNCASAPEYANLVGKTGSSEPLIRVSIAHDSFDLVWTVGVRISWIRCVVVPRFLFELSAAFARSADLTNHGPGASACFRYTLNVANPILLVPYNNADSHSKFFVLSMAQIRLGTVGNEDPPPNCISNYRLEVCSLQARRARQSDSGLTLIENCDLILDFVESSSADRIINCRLSPSAVTLGNAEVVLFTELVSLLQPLWAASPEIVSVVDAPLNISAVFDSIQLNLIAAGTTDDVFVSVRVMNLICTLAESLQSCQYAVTASQAVLQERSSDVDLIAVQSMTRSRPGLSLEWSQVESEPAASSVQISSLSFRLDDQPFWRMTTKLFAFIPERAEHPHAAFEPAQLIPARPISLLLEVDVLNCRLDDNDDNATLLFSTAVSVTMQFADSFPFALDHSACRLSASSVTLERSLDDDSDGTQIVSTSLILPFSSQFVLERIEAGDCVVALHLPKLDCCLSVDDAICCWNLIGSQLALLERDGLSSSSSPSASLLKVALSVDEACFQIVDDCATVFNAPMFRVRIEESSAEITDRFVQLERSLNCKIDVRLECDSYNRILNEWEPAVEPWTFQVESKSGSLINDLILSSSKTLDVNLSVASHANLIQVVSSWQRLRGRRIRGPTMMRTDQRRHFSVKNKTGVLLRVSIDSSSTSDSYEIPPDQDVILQTKQDDWNMKELFADRRHPRHTASKSLTVFIANGHDPDSSSFDYWTPIRHIPIDGTKIGDVNVHAVNRAENLSPRKTRTSKDDLSQLISTKTFLLSYLSSKNSMTISSPVLIRNHTPANFCFRVQTSAESVVGQFFVQSGTDCQFPMWALDDALGNATCLIRPFGSFSAEFATFFTLNELHLLPERLLPSRLVNCSGRIGVYKTTGFTFAMRSWTRKMSSSAFGIIIEPILSIINELPCPLHFCLESDEPDDVNEPIAPGGITHIHHATAKCRFRLSGGSRWSDLVAIRDPNPDSDRSILLDSSVEGSAPQPIKLEAVMVDCTCRLHIRVDYWFINRTGLKLFYGVMDPSGSHALKYQFRLCPGLDPSEISSRPQFKSSAASLRSLPVWADNAPWYAFPGPRRKEIETANPALGLVLLATEQTAPHLSWRPSCRDQAPETCSQMFTSNLGSLIGVRLSDSEWSAPFPIDSIVPLHVSFQSIRPHSSSGRDPVFRMFDVGVSCTTQASTTMVTIAPRYVLHNSTRRDLQYRQVGTMERVTLSPGSECAVHRYDSRKLPHLLFRFRQFGASWSGSVAIDQVGTVALRLLNRHNQDQSCIVRIDCTLRDATFEINVFEDPVVVQAPYRIENFTFLTLLFAQDGADIRQERVLPYHSKEFAWDEPMKSRKVVVYAIVDGRSDNPKTHYVGTYSLDRLCSHSAVRLAGHDRVLPHSRELRVDVVAIGAVRVLRVFDSMLDQSLKITHHEPNYSFGVRLKLAALGVSLIDMTRSGRDQQRREIAYVSVRRILVDVRRVQDVTGELRIRAGSIQIDNQSTSAAYPVVLVPSAPIPNDSDVFLDFFIIKSLQQSNDEFQFFPHCSLTIRPLDLRLEESFLSVSLKYLYPSLKLSDQTSSTIGTGSPTRALSPVRPGSRFRFDSIPAATITRFYCQTLSISSLYIRVSFASAPVVNSSAVNPFRVLARAAGASLANIEDVPVRLNAVHASDLFGTGSSLAVRLAHQYVVQLVREAYKLLASADVLGNPIGLLSNLSRGVIDVIYLPLRGIFISKSPRAFAVGVWMGCTSLLRNLLFGFCNASAKITSSIAKGVTSLAVYNDDRFSKYRTVPWALLYGTVGLFAEPFRDTSSMSQMYRGFVRGCTGFILLPLAAGFHTLASVSDMLRSLSDMRYRPARSRLPRHFDQGMILKKYDFFPVEVRKFAAKALVNMNEFLVGVVSNPPNFVVVTSESIFVLDNTEAQRVLTQISIREVFSMTTSENHRSLNLEMVGNAVPTVVLDIGSEVNARAVIKMFKYVRRRQRRMRHLQ